MSGPSTLPVLPLRNFVLFPGVTAPIQAGRPGTLKAIEAALAQRPPRVFAVSQRQTGEDIHPEDLHTIGTVARIVQVQRSPGSVQLLLQGEHRGLAVRIAEHAGGHLEALVRDADELPPLEPEDSAFVALLRETRERAAELGEKAGVPTEVVQQILSGIDSAAHLADLVAGHIDLPTAQKQMLLETLSVEERLRRVLVHVQRLIGVLEAQQDIKTKVQEELGGRQREMFLREQLKAIQKELGEDDAVGEVDDLKTRLAALELPAAVKKEVDRELGRLGRMGRESMESQVVRTYLETIADLPWNERSDEHLELGQAEAILDADHYALGDVKDRVLEFLAVRQLREKDKLEAPEDGVEEGQTKGPILLFAGPPGVGKTSVAKSIARSMGREYVRISLGGVRDEADIRGHRRTYVGAMLGRILQGMRQAGTKNPVFLLDEVDKLGVSYQGDPSAALLEVLDPAQNDSFTDHYLGVPFDLSEVLFIATANFLQNIPGPLLDRMEVVEFAGYTEGEKLEIARRFLVPRQCRENGLTSERLQLSDAALAELVSHYTREAGVRQLERAIGKLCRKVARKVAAGEMAEVAIDTGGIAPLLGRPKVHPEHAFEQDSVGVATGMFYTPVGGDIMFVEASTMRGKGELTLTGQLGDVMKESARAAWSYARAHAAQLAIREEAFDADVHIHVPAGAIPKDGPSAGITMATALVSTLSRRPVRHDVAMTGELTLSGRVLPIGGVKEKVLGAVRAGIHRIVLPRENVNDLEDLPKDVRDRIEVFPVDELGQVLALTLRGATFTDGRLFFGDLADDRRSQELPH